MNLLHIDSSLLGENSVSRALSQAVDNLPKFKFIQRQAVC